MNKDKELGTYVHGISSSNDLDSSGERLEIEGIDISSLTHDGLLNFEHQSALPNQLVGKILEAKKIFKESDCDNEHHKYFWHKAGKKPYLYVAGVLFDKFGHSGAMDVAAMLRFDKAIDTSNTKRVIGFSIEGSKLEKKGNIIKKCIARKVTITALECNKVCIAEILENPEGTKNISKESLFDIFKKTEELETDLKKSLILPKPKRVLPASKIKPKDNVKVGDKIVYDKPKQKTGKDIYNDPKTFKAEKPAGYPKGRIKILQDAKNRTKEIKEGNEKLKDKKAKKKKLDKFYSSNVQKAISASCGTGASPSSLSGIAALSKEYIVKTMKSLSDDAFDRMEKKEELVKFLTEKMPKLSKKEILAIAKTVAYVREKKLEKALGNLVEKSDSKEEKIGERIEKEHSKTIKQIIKDVKNGKVKQLGEYFEDIAEDHLEEIKDYYSRLVEMESKAKKEK